MEKKKLLVIMFTFFTFGLSVEVTAQSVPASVKKEITSLLKSHDVFCENADVTITVESIKLAPRKSGYIGACKYGGGPSVLFEKTASGFRQLIAVDTGMNGYFYREKKLTNGYYDFSNSERGGNEVEITTYKWNGNRYVAGRPKTMRVP